MYIKRPMCVFSLGFLIILYLALLIRGPAEADADSIRGMPEYAELTVYGIVERKEYKDEKLVIYLKDTSILNHTGNGRGFILYLGEEYSKTNVIKIGSRIIASGRLQRFSIAENEGQFDSKRYYKIKGYDAMLVNVKLEKISRNYHVIANTLQEIRMQTNKIYVNHMDEEKAGILSALVLGDKTGLAAEVKEQYQMAGIAHILSLSGLHIASLGLCLLNFLKKRGLPVWLSSLIATVIILAYGVMTGLSTSTGRALIMFFLGVLAFLIKRTYDLLSAAALAAVLMLIENPYFLFDAGFLLSFLAVLGIGILCPILNDLFGLHNSNKQVETGSKIICWAENITQTIKQGLCVSLATQLLSLPVVMWYFYQVPCYGALLNLIVVPLLGLLLGTGILAGILGRITILSGLTELVLKISSAILGLYNHAAGAVNRLPGRLWITGKPEKWQAVCYYLLLFTAVCIYWRSVSHKKNKSRGQEKQKLEKQKQIQKQRKLPFAVCMLGIICLAAIILSIRWKPELELNALSLGQGDGCVIMGRNTPVIIMDCGSSDEKQVGKYKLIPFLKANAIRHVDYIFLSHMDLDHISGIVELLEDGSCGITIDKIIISKAAECDEQLRSLAAARNIPVYVMEQGEVIRDKEVSIKALSPRVSTEDLWKLRDDNDNSLVLLLEYEPAGFRALFTGDISAEIEQELLKNGLEEITYLKVAHHGSKTASSEAFLNAVKPKLAMISAGKNNRYGHPHAETMEKLSDISSCITFDSGQISVRPEKGSLFVETYIEKSPKDE